jgi:hypothetical protein
MLTKLWNKLSCCLCNNTLYILLLILIVVIALLLINNYSKKNLETFENINSNSKEQILKKSINDNSISKNESSLTNPIQNDLFYDYRYNDVYTKNDFINGRGLVPPNLTPFLYDRNDINDYGKLPTLPTEFVKSYRPSKSYTELIKPFENSDVNCNTNFDNMITPINMKYDMDAEEPNKVNNPLDSIGRYMSSEEPDIMCKNAYSGFRESLNKKANSNELSRISMKRTQDHIGGGYYGVWCIDSQETDIPWSYNQNEFGTIDQQVESFLENLKK